MSALRGGGAGIKDDFAVAGSDDMGIGLNVDGSGAGGAGAAFGTVISGPSDTGTGRAVDRPRVGGARA